MALLPPLNAVPGEICPSKIHSAEIIPNYDREERPLTSEDRGPLALGGRAKVEYSPTSILKLVSMLPLTDDNSGTAVAASSWAQRE